jgi:hypothetical protein
LTAESPRAAAEQALAIQRDPIWLATAFQVVDETGDWTIDLQEDSA